MLNRISLFDIKKNNFNLEIIMLLEIPIDEIKFQKNDFIIAEDNNYIFVVTHGTKDGLLETPKGNLWREEEFLVETKKHFPSKKEMIIFACWEEARKNHYLNSKGTIQADIKVDLEDVIYLTIRYDE
jgi:hypothetical protein